MYFYPSICFAPLSRASGSSSEYEDVLPENTLQVEKTLRASAIKNNLDETSVRKIIKVCVKHNYLMHEKFKPISHERTTAERAISVLECNVYLTKFIASQGMEISHRWQLAHILISHKTQSWH